MSNGKLWIGVPSAALLLGTALAGVNDPADLAEVRSFELRVASVQTTDEVMRLYRPDATVFDGMAPGYYPDAKVLRIGYAPQYDATDALMPQVEYIDVVTDGKMACAFSQQSFNVFMKNGDKFKLSLRMTDVLKKDKQGWRIAHEHFSYPLDPKTLAGVMAAPLPPADPMVWAGGNPLPGPGIPEAQAGKEIRAWAEAQANSQTIDQAMNTFGPGDDVLLYDSIAPGTARGLKEIRAVFEPQMQFKSIAIKFKTLGVDTDGLLGVVHSIQQATITAEDGSIHTAEFRQTDCLRRVDGKWYSFHEHVSFPIDAKTGKGEM